MKTTFPVLILAPALALLMASCASPSVKMQSRPMAAFSPLANLLDRGKLSPEAEAYLKAQGLQGAHREDPEQLISALRQKLAAEPSGTGRLALIEVCTIAADRVEAANPRKAVGYHLAAAEAAFEKSFHRASIGDPLVEAYNNSTEQIVRILFDPEGPLSRETAFPGPGKTSQLHIQKSGPGVIDPLFFDDLFPADLMAFKDVELERHVTPGVGAALVGHRKGTPERRKVNPFLSPEGMSLPVNATLAFSNGGSRVDLTFHDLTIADSIRLAGRSIPLSADRTASLAVLYDFAPKHNVGWAGMLHPDDYAKRMGLYQLEPFRSDRIPVIFVHGLMSSPETWFTTLNKLAADPVLREHYQPLVFYYPTGFPIAYNAAILRRFLKDFQQAYDPNRRNPAMRDMIMVGHSMGGLLTSAQIRDSGDIFSSELFTKPIDELDGLSEAQKQALKTLLIYEANPDISRAVFVAAPHRGSDIATNPIGKLGSSLIRFPLGLAAAEPLPLVDGMTALGRQLVTARPDGIKDLAPNAPELMAVLKEPVRAGVPFHSIIGRHNPKDSLEDSSDTVVPFWSSHLEGAISQKVVQAKHTTITRNEDSNEEIRRILYRHAGLPYQVSRSD